MLSSRRPALVLAILALASGLALTPRADASWTIGESYFSTQGAACEYGGTYIQTASPGNQYAAPFDGVITSWGNHGYKWSTLSLKVARVGAGGYYTVIGSDGPRSTAGNIGQLTSFPVRIPVRQGDVIGARIAPGTWGCLYGGGGAGYTSSQDDEEIPVGGLGLFDSAGTLQPPIEAEIERDRDGDGYGDETQDGCPTNAATQGPCPLPTTLGQTFTPSSTTTSTGTAIPARPADYRYVAPADGVITSWSYQANALVDGTAKLKTVRPLGGDDFLVIAESAPRTPVASTLNTFPTRLPVREGDRIGIGASNLPVISFSNYDNDSSWFAASDPPPGTSTAFAKSSRLINVSAILEADADNDGYGDTTQDRCPTNASTQAACPVKPPPPPVDAACEKAKAKLSKAKAKLAKLKKNDAPAKKVKKAKKAVKKAKGKVKKAC